MWLTLACTLEIPIDPEALRYYAAVDGADGAIKAAVPHNGSGVRYAHRL